MGSVVRRLVAASIVLVLTGTPVAASACALSCPPGMGHAPASPAAWATGTDDASVHEGCREHDPAATWAGESAQRVTAAAVPTVGDDDCCTVDAVRAAEIPQAPERADAAFAAQPAPCTTLVAAPRRGVARTPDPPRTRPRLSRASVLRI